MFNPRPRNPWEDASQPYWFDAAEAEALFDLLEREVIPEFYTRDSNGIPTAWVARMRESIAQLTPRFSANRAVREYTEQRYLPAAASYRERAANNGKFGTDFVKWQRLLEEHWSMLHFGEVKSEILGEQHIFEEQVYLDGLDPDAVRVELFANGINCALPERIEMKRVRQLVGAVNGYAYHADVPAIRPASDYTARLIPHLDGVAVPLESSRVLWQR